MIDKYEQLLAAAKNYLAAKDALNAPSYAMNIDNALQAHNAAAWRLRFACDGDAVQADNYTLAKKEQAHNYTNRHQKPTLRCFVVRTQCTLRTIVGYAREQDDGGISLQMEGEYRPFLMEIDQPPSDSESTEKRLERGNREREMTTV